MNCAPPHPQVALDEAKIMGLDDALEYITDDEQVEVTPQSIRIRKVGTTAVLCIYMRVRLTCTGLGNGCQ